MKLSGIKHNMSMVYHPQTNGASECSNKTVVQAFRFHVEHNQTRWTRVLPKVHFDIMNTINASIGFTPFMLKSAHSLHLIPPLIDVNTPDVPSPASNKMLSQPTAAAN